MICKLRLLLKKLEVRVAFHHPLSNERDDGACLRDLCIYPFAQEPLLPVPQESRKIGLQVVKPGYKSLLIAIWNLVLGELGAHLFENEKGLMSLEQVPFDLIG